MNNKCYFCEKEFRLHSVHCNTGRHEHHIKPIKYGGDKKDVHNISVICSKCHAALHKRYIEEAFRIVLKKDNKFFDKVFRSYLEECNIKNGKEWMNKL